MGPRGHGVSALGKHFSYICIYDLQIITNNLILIICCTPPYVAVTNTGPKETQIVATLFQMIDFKLVAAFIGWTTTTFVAHYSIKRILVAATPYGAKVCLKIYGF